MYSPDKDGIDHINIYSKAKTSLGVFLSNFTACDIETDDGEFQSIEAYWYWLLAPPFHQDECPECDGKGVAVIGTGVTTDFGPCPECSREALRYLSGFEAKKLGKKLCGVDYPAEKDSEFRTKIKKAVRYKIENNTTYLQTFKESKLPFGHYYVYYGKPVYPKSGEWIIEYIEELRRELGC